MQKWYCEKDGKKVKRDRENKHVFERDKLDSLIYPSLGEGVSCNSTDMDRCRGVGKCQGVCQLIDPIR